MAGTIAGVRLDSNRSPTLSVGTGLAWGARLVFQDLGGVGVDKESGQLTANVSLLVHGLQSN